MTFDNNYRSHNMKQTRQKILSEVQIVAKKPRFGLFSQPPPIALCDNSFFQSKSANKGEDGKPRTKPRNMLGGANRTGIGRRAFTHYPESIYQKDPYKDPFKIELEYQRKIHGRSVLHQNQFKPASTSKTLTNSSYLHIEQKQSKERKKADCDENGRVKTEPANVLTNPTSKIEVRLFQHVKHIKDQYSRLQDIQKQQRDLWRSKIKGETMFRSNSHGGNSFTKERVQFGLDDKSKMALSQRKPFRFGPYVNRVKHEIKFKLARRGHGDPIGRYPEFIDRSTRMRTEETEVKRLRTDKSEAERDTWRPSTGDLSRPTPSISLMARNLLRHA